MAGSTWNGSIAVGSWYDGDRQYGLYKPPGGSDRCRSPKVMVRGVRGHGVGDSGCEVKIYVFDGPARSNTLVSRVTFQ